MYYFKLNTLITHIINNKWDYKISEDKKELFIFPNPATTIKIDYFVNTYNINITIEDVGSFWVHEPNQRRVITIIKNTTVLLEQLHNTLKKWMEKWGIRYV